MLSQNVNDYVALRRALGFKFRIQNTLLQHFANFAERRGDEFVHTQTVLDWAKEAPSRVQQHNRLLIVRQFAKAMRAEDPRHQIPSADAFGRVVRQRRRPYIYSDADLSKLFMAASHLTPTGSVRSLTFMTLIGLLVVSGLRISEALALSASDITDDGLTVRATKFCKDRLVPIHPSTREKLDHYLSSRLRPHTSAPAVFVSLTGSRLAYSTAISTFLHLLRGTDLRNNPHRGGPCFHDLRHTFAVRSLEQCPENAQAISRHMTALSTYLGHAHVSDTYWYLQATPKLLRRIASATQALHTGVLS